MNLLLTFSLASALALAAAPARAEVPNASVDGYRGIWYGLGTAYSGGMATYTQHHMPMAVYDKTSNKTFFVYGGSHNNHMAMMVSFYDHAAGTVPRPVMVRECMQNGKAFMDAHANPSLTITADGHLWVFAAARGGFPGQILRSKKPRDISAFELVTEDYIPYPQPWATADGGIFLLYTKYTGGRESYWRTTADGRTWTKEQMLADGGHYQASTPFKGTFMNALDWHPGSSDNRTNLYFVLTPDAGKTWKNIDGKGVSTPLKFPDNDALVRDYKKDNRYVFLNDITVDADGHPLIFYITSNSGAYGRGEKGSPRWWTTAYHDGKAWRFSEVTKVDHNYDVGGIYAEADGTWRIIGPSGVGPFADYSGGEVAVWTSGDKGATWKKTADLTANSTLNHNFVRRPHLAHEGFYALWADGDATKRSGSHLYFATRSGDVYRLPFNMKTETATPEKLPHIDKPK